VAEAEGEAGDAAPAEMRLCAFTYAVVPSPVPNSTVVTTAVNMTGRALLGRVRRAALRRREGSARSALSEVSDAMLRDARYRTYVPHRSQVKIP
jgi:hypothetical protein